MRPVQVVIVGGCGRVGLPLGLALARAGSAVTLFDVNAAAVEQVHGGQMPFHEEGADELLARVLANGMLDATTDPDLRRHRRARRRGDRHARRRAPQPGARRRCSTPSSAARPTSATASTWCFAARSTPA